MGKEIFVSGNDFYNHLNDIMRGDFYLAKVKSCIKAKFLTHTQWNHLLESVAPEEWWDKYGCVVDGFYDGGLSEEEFDGEAATRLRELAEKIMFTIPTWEGVTIAIEDGRYYQIHTIED